MRWDIINYLIQQNKYSNYLEVGVQDYYSCCARIELKEDSKVTVDPFPRNKCDYVMTSDQYFEQLSKDTFFDIVFIDGLHHSDQVYRDIINSLNHLKEGGVIVVHDCLPTSEVMQQRTDNGGPWMGDVWKAIVELKATREDLDICTVDHDCGCGIIKRGKQELNKADLDNLTWETYQKNYSSWMNVISLEDFYKKYEKA